MKESSGATGAWVLAPASVASLMVALDTLVVATALSTIRLDLGASIEELEWTVNAYSLSFAVLLMTGAALGDRFGRRRMFAAGLGLFVAASAACALASGIGWLIAARTVQGAGAALVTPLALTLLSAAFPPERRGMALGILEGVTGLAVVGGPLVGGAVAGGLAWEWIFWLNVPIGLLTIPLALARIPESYGTDTALDIRRRGPLRALRAAADARRPGGERAGRHDTRIGNGIGGRRGPFVVRPGAVGGVAGARTAGAPARPDCPCNTIGL